MCRLLFEVRMADLFSGDDEADAKIKGIERSAEAQSNAAKEAQKAQEEALGKARETLDPFRENIGRGSQAFSKLAGLSGVGTAEEQRAAFQEFQDSPATQFLREQGLRGIENSTAFSGGLGGGNRLKAISRFNQGLANQSLQQTLGNLTNFGNLGLGLANQFAGFDQSLGNIRAGTAQSIGDINAERFTARAGVQAEEKKKQAQAIVNGVTSLATTALTGGLGSLGGIVGGVAGAAGGGGGGGGGGFFSSLLGGFG